MRKSILILFILSLIASSCADQPEFTIEGKVPNFIFQGSKVYLVALDAPVTKNVDSTTVENGKFSFTIPADSFSVKILRIQAKYPFIVEDLVVIPEPGRIDVVLDSVSHGNGTKLNNILGQWKLRKHFYDTAQWNLFAQKNAITGDKAASDSLMKVSEKMNQVFMSDNICLLNENLYNGIGLLLYKIYFDRLPDSEKNYVTQKTGKMYIEKDAELKKRFY
jgi:hypothetical protein